MAAANVKQQLEDITECPICFNIFTDPRVLPCVHTYCRKCIESFCIDKVKGDEIACPECRKNFTIPEGGVEKLPKHFIMTKLLEMKDLPIASPEVPPTVNSSDETCSRFPPSYCETHREKNLEIYCFNCKTVCCVTCLVDQHNGHKFTEVDKVSNELRAETTNHVKCLTGRIDKNRGRLKHLDDQKQRFADKVAEVEAEINERATQLHDLIERRRQAMLDELLEVRNGRVKEIDNLRNEVEQNTSMITSLENHVKRWNETGSACDIAREANSLKLRCDDLMNDGGDNMDKCIENLGSIEISFTAADNKRKDEFSVVGKLAVQLTRPSDPPGTPTLMRVIPCGDSNEGVGSLAMYGNQLFVGRYGAARIEVYDTATWSLQRRLSVTGLGNTVVGLAACDLNKCLYVSDYHLSSVHKVDLSTYDVALIWRVAATPWGLSVNSAHNLLVACSGAKKLQEYSSVGSLIREIIISGGSPTHGIQLSNDLIVVSQNGDSHRICVIDAGGQVVKSYGNQAGSGPGQLCYPYCMAADKKGCVLVADYGNHRIVALDPSATDACELPLSNIDKLMQPISMCFDESRGRLYVGEHGGYRRVLVFENVTGISAMFTDQSHQLPSVD